MRWILISAILLFLAGCTSEIDINQGDNLTSEGFESEVIFNDLSNPWGMSFISKNELLLTQKNKGLLLLDLEGLEKSEILGLPDFIKPGQGGLLDVYYHEGFVYLTYVAENEDHHSTRLGKGLLNKEDLTLENFEIMHISSPALSGGSHFGSRILINDDYVYYTTGDRGRKDFGPDHVGQNTQNTLGTVIRLNINGSVPDNNPFLDNESVLDEIYTFGHRNPQGITLNNRSNDIWISDHGENDGDEINILKAGANYGWPIAHMGCRYGTRLRFAESPFDLENIENPIHYWDCGTGGFPPSGMTFYFGERYEELQGNLLIGNLAGSYLGRFKVENESIEELNPLFEGERVRDVTVSLDDYIYFITDSGKLLKIK